MAKKTILGFMTIFTFVWAVWEIIKGISLETSIPPIVIIVFVIILYFVWHEDII